jgi:hypothetical protein
VEINGRFEVTKDGQTQTCDGTVTITEQKTSDLTCSSGGDGAFVMGYDFTSDAAEAIDGASLSFVSELRFREQ